MEGAIYMQWIRAGLLGVSLVFSTGLNASLELVSRIEGEPPVDRGPNRESNHPAISADGRFVVFLSDASNLPGGFTNPFQDNVFLYDRDTDTVKPLTSGANAASFEPAISADGRFVAFSSLASNPSISSYTTSKPIPQSSLHREQTTSAVPLHLVQMADLSRLHRHPATW